MALNLGPASDGGDDAEPILDINTTPLIDVMLVLLVMIIITIPIQLHSVRMDMASGPTAGERPDVVELMIDENNVVHWNEAALSGHVELQARMAAAAARPLQPEVHIRSHDDARYDTVAYVMASASRAGLVKLGLVDVERFVR